MASAPIRTTLANPAPLGLAGFALTTWLLSMINAGWFSGESMGLVLACALAYGGTAQAIAGMMELPRGNTFGATAFLSYGAFWWSFALFVLFLHDKVPPAFVGWYLFLWGVFTFYMWLATFRSPRALQFIFLGALDHLRPAGWRRVDGLRPRPDGGRLYGAHHRGAGVLSVRSRRDQRGARASGSAGRRSTGA